MRSKGLSIEIICAGIGGRGVLLASTLLIDSAVRKNVYAIGSDEYGMSQRGGSVISQVKIGNVKSPIVGKGRADILLGFEESEFLRNVSYLKKKGIGIVNTNKSEIDRKVTDALKERSVRLYLLDADEIARREGLFLASNMAVLGFLSSLGIEPLTYENLKEAIIYRLQGKMLEGNLKVFENGYRKGLEILK
ncbi:MAG: 2-oxoacid:acceptor oxidoreductase family protein [Desulfobacterota bacterium]|nr:2-oxoacid:acceptor oxidoreductase family protein [Thermodesulfobacteriota bacterium]MDW8001214.1 2-oxoacid:acceptor oxidoreductase family protein [Deltaproteobacteria bacterium]